ncbi:hypothetical protein FOL47_001137, partial [Perkinsus chesapeaki]
MSELLVNSSMYNKMIPGNASNVVLRGVDPLGRLVFSGRVSDSTSSIWRSSAELKSFDYILHHSNIDIIDLDASHSLSEIFFVTASEFGIIDAHSFSITYIDNIRYSHLSGVVFDSDNDAVYLSSQSDHVVFRYKRISGVWMPKEVLVGEIGISGSNGILIDTPTSLDILHGTLTIRVAGGVSMFDLSSEKGSLFPLPFASASQASDAILVANDRLVAVSGAPTHLSFLNPYDIDCEAVHIPLDLCSVVEKELTLKSPQCVVSLVRGPSGVVIAQDVSDTTTWHASILSIHPLIGLSIDTEEPLRLLFDDA